MHGHTNKKLLAVCASIRRLSSWIGRAMPQLQTDEGLRRVLQLEEHDLPRVRRSRSFFTEFPPESITFAVRYIRSLLLLGNYILLVIY